MKLDEYDIIGAVELLKDEAPITMSLEKRFASYINKRIRTKKYCSEEELEYLNQNIETISTLFTKKNPMVRKIKNLVLSTLDEKNQTNYYEKVIEFEVWQNQFDSKRFFEYILIHLNIVPQYANEEEIKQRINSYFKKGSSLFLKYKLFDLIKRNGASIFTEEDLTSYEEQLYQETRIYDSSILLVDYCKTDNENFNEIENQINKIKEYSTWELTDVQSRMLINALEKSLTQMRVKFASTNNQKLFQIINDINDISSKIKEQLSIADIIKRNAVSGDIVLSNEFPKKVLNSINYNFYYQPFVEDENIITIDDADSEDLDGAFSIKKEDGNYVLKVYITDVPSFLNENRPLCKEAYKRGCSIYLKCDGIKKTINMLPANLANDILSLRMGQTNTICFELKFDSMGSFISYDISKKSIIVDNRLDYNQAEQMLNSSLYLGKTQEDLKTYKELVSLVNKQEPSMKTMVAFPTIQINNIVAQESEFAIYYKGGNYTDKKLETPYVRATTPLRNFTSDINLAFFLNQKGIGSFPECDLNYVADNKSEIISHLNSCHQVAVYTKKRPYTMKKYIN